MGITVNYGKIVKVFFNEEGELILKFEDDSELSFGTVTNVENLTCEHQYVVIEEYEANCVTAGYTISKCAKCGDTQYSFNPATGHSYGEAFFKYQYDGETKGYALFDCKVCGTVKKEEVIFESEGLNYTLINDDSEYSVSGIGTCEDKTIIVPSEHEGLPVTEIGQKAFYDCDFIESVKLPASVKTIRDKAFSECENLIDVEMPDAVTMGVDVFRGSIHVEIIVRHKTVFIEGKDATCYEAGYIAHYLCEICNYYYADADCKTRIYDVTISPSHDFEDGVCSKCGKIQDSVKIVEVDTIAHLGKFPLGTLENAIGLPDAIKVKTADGEYHTLSVIWDLSSYNKAVIGEYVINGTIQADTFHFSEEVTNKVSARLEIVAAMKGTADIVFVLDISGSMSDEISSVKNNITQFAQNIEDRGVSVRWSAVTYSDFTVSGENEKSQIIKNGASNWFTSTADFKTAIAGIELAYGGDEPETAFDGLMLASTIENRQDARVFYILVTDATYKTNNNYGVDSLSEVANLLNNKGVNVSVITDTSLYSDYNALISVTGGLKADIDSSFSTALFDKMVPIIYEEVIA